MRQAARLIFGTFVLGFGAYICLSLAWSVAHGTDHSDADSVGPRNGGPVIMIAGVAFLMAGSLILSGKKRK